MRKFKLVYLLMFLMLISFGCKKSVSPYLPDMDEAIEPTPEPTGNPPEIYFWATDKNKTRLRLHVRATSGTNGDYLKLIIDWGFQNSDLDPSDGLVIETWRWMLLDNQIYTATAENKWGTTTKSWSYGEQGDDEDDEEDDSPPIIDYFRANPLTIQNGDSSELSWKVRKASNVEIDNEIGSVDSSGTLLVFPTETTTYTLTTVNGYGTKQSDVTITVTDLPPPEIDVEVCSVTELLPSEWCENTEIKTYIVGTEPTEACEVCPEEEIELEVCKETDLLPNANCETKMKFFKKYEQPTEVCEVCENGEANVVLDGYDWDFDFNDPNPNGRYAKLSGKVENIGTSPAYSVHIYVKLYYKSGGVFSEKVGELGIIQPDGKQNFVFRWTYGSGEIDPFINDEINLTPEFSITWD